MATNHIMHIKHTSHDIRYFFLNVIWMNGMTNITGCLPQRPSTATRFHQGIHHTMHIKHTSHYMMCLVWLEWWAWLVWLIWLVWLVIDVCTWQQTNGHMGPHHRLRSVMHIQAHVHSILLKHFSRHLKNITTVFFKKKCTFAFFKELITTLGQSEKFGFFHKKTLIFGGPLGGEPGCIYRVILIVV